MAKSHPAQSEVHAIARHPQWARSIIASLVLLATLLSLALILHDRYGRRVAGAMIQGLKAFAPAPAYGPVVEAPPVVMDPNLPKYRAIGEYVARRYKVSMEVTTDIVAKAYAVGQELKLDPMLILAVISVESKFNPIAESRMGAKGLMQIIPRYHTDKLRPLGGEKVAFEPSANILVGAKILRDYLRFTGDLPDALQMYVGASTEENENGYSNRVISERDRLHRVVRQFQEKHRAPQPVLQTPAI